MNNTRKKIELIDIGQFGWDHQNLAMAKMLNRIAMEHNLSVDNSTIEEEKPLGNPQRGYGGIVECSVPQETKEKCKNCNLSGGCTCSSIPETKESWEGFREQYKDLLFPFGGDWNDFDVEAFYSLLSSERNAVVEEVEQKLIEFAEPYEYSKWLNTLAVSQIEKFFNSLKN